MTIILISPLLAIEQVTTWTRNLLNTDVTIDGKSQFTVVEMLHFQAIQAENEQVRIMALVRLFGPLREGKSNG